VRSDWLFFVHVLAAFVLVGGVLAVVTVSLAAARRPADAVLLRRTAFLTNLVVVIPSFVALYAVGITLADDEFGDAEPGWLDTAFPITDFTLIVGGPLLALLQYWVLRRARGGQTGGWQATLANVVPVLVLAALGAVVFLMSAKP